MSKGSRRTKIPKEMVSMIIKTSWKNYLRLRNDAEALFNINSNMSAVQKLLESVEELTKIIVLLPYYKQQIDVPEDVVKELFRSHQYRFKEFNKYFHTNLPSNPTPPDILDKFSEWMGNYEQDYKEKMTYVDWIDDKIHDPTYIESFAITDERDIESNIMLKFQTTSITINTVIQNLQTDSDFTKALQEKNIDIPSLLKINRMIREILKNDHVPTKCEMKGKDITISLDSKHELVNENNRRIVRDTIKARYPDYNIIVRMEDMK